MVTFSHLFAKGRPKKHLEIKVQSSYFLGNVESSVAIEFYRNNVDMFINYDAMDDYVEELSDEYGVDDVALFIQGGCRIYMGNPYYEEGVSNRPTAFEIYCKELENVKDGQM